MNTTLLALANVRALRRRLVGLVVLVAVAVALCVASFAVSGRAQDVSSNRIQEGVANRSIQLDRLGERDDTRTLTTGHLRQVAALPHVDSVEPVAQVSFGYKSASVPGVLLYATTPRPSLLPPMVDSVGSATFPLKPDQVVLPSSSGGQSLAAVLGQDISVQITRNAGAGQGIGTSRTLHVVGLFDPSWQLDGPDSAYVADATVTGWAALRAGVPGDEYAAVVGYDTVTVLADSSDEVPALLDRLQSAGYAATSLQQQLDALPAVLDLIRVVGIILLLSLVLLTGFSAYQVTAALGRQRRREVGILKAVGYTDGAVFRMLGVEAVAVGLVGAVVGLVLSVAVASAGNAILRHRGDLRDFLAAGVVTPGGGAVGLTVLIVLGVVVAGAVIPALRAARLQPADAIREW